MKTGLTRANANRKVRQEALRDQLTTQGHVQHIVEILDKLSDLDTELDQLMLARYKLVLDTKLKLINKYLPDLKQSEPSLSSPEEGTEKRITIEFV